MKNPSIATIVMIEQTEKKKPQNPLSKNIMCLQKKLKTKFLISYKFG